MTRTRCKAADTHTDPVWWAVCHVISTAICPDPETGQSAEGSAEVSVEGSVEGYAEAVGGGHRTSIADLKVFA